MRPIEPTGDRERRQHRHRSKARRPGRPPPLGYRGRAIIWEKGTEWNPESTRMGPTHLGWPLSSSPKRKNFSPSEGIRRVGWHFSARVSSECGVPNSEGFVGECYAISQPYPSNVHTLRTFPVNICDRVIWSRSHLGQERSLSVLCSSQKQSEHLSLRPCDVTCHCFNLGSRRVLTPVDPFVETD